MLASTEIADGNNVWCVAGRSDVEANVRSTRYPNENLIFVEGDVAADTEAREDPVIKQILEEAKEEFIENKYNQ